MRISSFSHNLTSPTSKLLVPLPINYPNRKINNHQYLAIKWLKFKCLIKYLYRTTFTKEPISHEDGCFGFINDKIYMSNNSLKMKTEAELEIDAVKLYIKKTGLPENISHSDAKSLAVLEERFENIKNEVIKEFVWSSQSKISWW